MASAWGKSWGVAWRDSWGLLTPTPSPLTPDVFSGGGSGGAPGTYTKLQPSNRGDKKLLKKKRKQRRRAIDLAIAMMILDSE